jgi:hypothetical protein
MGFWLCFGSFFHGVLERLRFLTPLMYCQATSLPKLPMSCGITFSMRVTTYDSKQNQFRHQSEFIVSGSTSEFQRKLTIISEEGREFLKSLIF